MIFHPTAEVISTKIGSNTRIWQHCVVLAGASIGSDCNLCSHVFVENDVVIGDRVTIKSGVQLWDGIEVGDDVFIGPNATFSNDKFPRSRQLPEKFLRTTVGRGASIGGNATILPGITIGECAMIGAGAVVTRSVPDYAIVSGNPARITGYVGYSNGHPIQFRYQRPSSSTVQITALAGCFVHELAAIKDLRGNLSVLEFKKDVPFNVKRCFWIYQVPSSEVRGEHAHYKCEQFLVCISGSVELILDNGSERCGILLDRPTLGVHIPPMRWAVQYNYSKDAVLIVFASHHYDDKDYIRDYQHFRASLVGSEGS